jgi:CheY-like chemotaxis protein
LPGHLWEARFELSTDDGSTSLHLSFAILTVNTKKSSFVFTSFASNLVKWRIAMNTANVFPVFNPENILCADLATTSHQSFLHFRGKHEPPLRRVLIVEFRDDVFEGLKRLLENQGCEVYRVRFAGTVVYHVQQFKPDLILLSDRTSEGSGWLVSCKLQLTACLQPIWIYSSQNNLLVEEWKAYCGVDAVVAYDGSVNSLKSAIDERLWCGVDSKRESGKRSSEFSRLRVKKKCV